MKIGIRVGILCAVDPEIDIWGGGVVSPRVASVVVSSCSPDPFGFRRQTAVSPFRISVGAWVIDAEDGGIAGEMDLAVVSVSFAGLGKHVGPISGC